MNSILFNALKYQFFLRKEMENNEELDNFFTSFPQKYMIQLVNFIYKPLIIKIKFLFGKPDEFLSRVCHLLDQRKINKDDYIIDQENLLQSVYFLLEGQAGFVIKMPLSKNIVYVKIEEGDEIGTVDI